VQSICRPQPRSPIVVRSFGPAAARIPIVSGTGKLPKVKTKRQKR